MGIFQFGSEAYSANRNVTFWARTLSIDIKTWAFVNVYNCFHSFLRHFLDIVVNWHLVLFNTYEQSKQGWLALISWWNHFSIINGHKWLGSSLVTFASYSFNMEGTSESLFERKRVLLCSYFRPLVKRRMLYPSFRKIFSINFSWGQLMVCSNTESSNSLLWSLPAPPEYQVALFPATPGLRRLNKAWTMSNAFSLHTILGLSTYMNR